MKDAILPNTGAAVGPLQQIVAGKDVAALTGFVEDQELLQALLLQVQIDHTGRH